MSTKARERCACVRAHVLEKEWRFEGMTGKGESVSAREKERERESERERERERECV